MKEATVLPNTDFLSGSGEMGKRIRKFDWCKTPLGATDTWSQSLRTTVSIMLSNRFPLLLWWGEDYISIYNDAYIPVLGGKHPWALGKPVKECWSEIWNILQPLIDRPFKGGEPTWIEDFPLEINRNGFWEETHFTVAYSAVPDEQAIHGIGGVLATVHEITDKIISERAVATLRELGAVTFEEQSLDAIYRNVAEALGKNNKDFPFTLVYKISDDGKTATVAASAGIDKKQHVFPEVIDTANPNKITKEFCEAYRANKLIVSDIKAEDINMPTGAWNKTPNQFVHLPVSIAGATHPYCIISAALSPFRKFDDSFRQFCQLIADRVSIEINKMLALQEEKKKAEALAEIDRAKTVFFSNISHEFRTPLTLLLNPLEELLNGKKTHFSESEKENLETSHRNAVRLLKLVNALLAFSRIESGRQQAKFVLTNIGALTKNLASNFRSLIEKAGLKFTIKADRVMEPVYVDRQMWEKIIFNLLSNAYKYTLSGSITVELKSEKGFAVLKVKDTGVGIPKEELPKMFERFHRVENVVGRTYEGTGIGLSFIKELVLLHQGEIDVESELNKGSTFTVKIPAGKEHISAEQISTTDLYNEPISDSLVDEADVLFSKSDGEKKPGLNGKQNQHLPHVLVVDDNADMRQYLQLVLSDHFYVSTANNGMDALHKISEQPPELVLSDVMMPVMDGIALLSAIKSNKNTAQIPVILLTARAGEESKVEGLNTGADDYLVKPFSAKELVSRLQTHIKTKKLRDEAIHSLENVLQRAPAAIAVLEGREHIYKLANAEYEKIVNRKAADIVGKPFAEVFPDLAESETMTMLDSIYETGTPVKASEYPMKLDLDNDGMVRQRYFDFGAEPLKEADGKVSSIMVIAYETTDRVAARKKIEEIAIENSRLAAIVQSSEDAIISKTLEGIITSWNTGAEKLFGYTAKEMIGESVTKLIPHDRLFEEPDIVRKIVKGEGVDHFETIRLTKDGKLRNISLTISPIRDGEGKIVGASKIARDITEQAEARKRIEESEKLLDRKVKERTLELAQANNELKKMNKELESFVFISSHDLQEPLRKIRMFSKLIADTEEKNLSADGRDHFGRMKIAAGNMQKLLNDLLMYSRIGNASAHFEFTDLNVLLEEAMEELQERIRESNAVIESDVLPRAKVIVFQVRQLFTNIIANAIKFAKPHTVPVIKINSRVVDGKTVKSLQPGRRYHHLSFADNGIGFESIYNEKVFDVFQRLHGKEQYAGSGIGLSIVKKIMDNHEGMVSAEGDVDKGAVFHVYIPAD